VTEGLATLFDVYRAQFRATVALQLQYRVMLAIWLVWTVVEPVIYLVVWSTVARSSGGQVGGYGPSEFAGYYLLAMWVTQLTFTWLMWEFEFRIRHGQFSPKLLRPIHPIHSDIAENVTYKLLTAVVLFPVTFLLIYLFQPTAATTWADVALFVPALLIAFVLRFVTGWTLALAAFWTTRVSAVNNLFFTVQIFLSGQMVPLSVLPDWLQTVTWLLPFRWMVAFPVELGLGRLDERAVAIGFAMQLLWTVASLLAVRVTWRSAIRRYTAVGA
jgi:viologen exporter family transport system permease protein